MYENAQTQNESFQQKAAKQYYDEKESIAQGAVCGQTPYRPSTLREEAEKSAAYHSEQISKNFEAARFFRDHPEFDEFILLIRSGTIQI